MTRTAVVSSPIYLRHNPGARHPESARRLQAIVRELKRNRSSVSRNWEFISPEKARKTQVQLIHGTEYIKLVEAICKSGGGLLDLQDTVTSPESYDVALYAVGGTLKAVNLVMRGHYRNALALVRPPGHHAGRFRGLGFCIFNNVAIAAEYIIREFKLKRVLILDIDAHHGNGTQEAFYGTSKVLYISLHEDPSSFPGTGFTDEIGEGEGLGYNVNIPLPFGTGDRVYLKAIQEIVAPITRRYNPEFMLVSAGFDSHYSDPVGNLSLSATCYQQIYESIIDLASKACAGKLVAVLEGGYNPTIVGRLATAMILRMSGAKHLLNDKAARISRKTELDGLRILKEVNKIQRAFWSID